MFGRKKRIKEERDFSNTVDALLKDKTISEKERQALIQARKNIDKDMYFPRILTTLEGELQPIALKSELTPKMEKVYSMLIEERFRSDLNWAGFMFM